MTRTESDISYDPYDLEINANPYPVYRRLREEAPLYYNEEYDFWALSRHADVEGAVSNYTAFSHRYGAILEMIKARMVSPPGNVLGEDPPMHPVHRKLMSRVFTPKKMNALEEQTRAYCASCLDPLVGEEKFDFVKDLGNEMPMRVIGMLLGIPESDQKAVRHMADRELRTEPGKPMVITDRTTIPMAKMFTEYIDYREKHPSDDLMTALLTSEFEDHTGAVRKLTREEVLVYVSVVAGAGNETTGRLIGWLGKVLGEHPDERRDINENRELIPNVIDEMLRFEPTGPHLARYVARDVEYYGTTVPEGSAMLLLVGSANRDPQRWTDPDRFDPRRSEGQHLTFGFGIHFCLGASLARMEGRVALQEVLNRFPDWEIDYGNIRMASTSTVRGWETLPVFVR
ncbi:MAG: cytochrome P450 [Acidimicrobiales bacterium]|jgi:cytochrome P450